MGGTDQALSALNIGNETDGLNTQFGQRRNQCTTKMESNNPIYEGGAIYETTPGESMMCLIPPVRAPDSAHHYVDQPPSLPPPRVQEPMDEIDAIKASLKHAELPQTSEAELGDVYVAMGPNSTFPNENNRKDIPPDHNHQENASRDGSNI